MVRFQKNYFTWTIVLFIIEVLIALFVHDRIIRPYIGDLLVVILIYCFVRSFLNTPVLATVAGVLLFSFTVEVLQYFHLVRLLGLQHSRLATIVLGSSFEWIDLLSYTLGALIIAGIEKAYRKW